MQVSRLFLIVLAFGLVGTAQTVKPLPGHVQTVWIILMENHNWSQIHGSKAAPYVNNTLLPMASHAEQYFNPRGFTRACRIICGWRPARISESSTIIRRA